MPATLLGRSFLLGKDISEQLIINEGEHYGKSENNLKQSWAQ